MLLPAGSTDHDVLDLSRAQPVTGHVDDVIHAARDLVIAARVSGNTAGGALSGSISGRWAARARLVATRQGGTHSRWRYDKLAETGDTHRRAPRKLMAGPANDAKTAAHVRR